MEELLATLARDLDDEEVWSVLADRLDDADDRRADLVRLDLAARKARRRGDVRRARAFERRLRVECLDRGIYPLPLPRNAYALTFGGLRIGLHAAGLDSLPRFAEDPLTCALAFTDREVAGVAAHLATPPRQIRALRIEVTRDHGDDASWLDALPALPRVTQLRLLPTNLRRTVSRRVIAHALRADWLPGLRFLDLSGVRAADAVPALVGSPHLALEGLTLTGSGMTDRDLAQLSAWPGLARVRRLVTGL